MDAQGALARVMLVVHPDDAHRVRITPGRRYIVALVEIDSDETAVQAEEEMLAGRRVRRNSNAAALLCLRPEFNRWAARQLPAGTYGRLDQAGKAFIYRVCRIASRAELDRNRAAARRFHEQVELPFAREEAST
ncbi:MAG: hypothetical protein IT349_19440 [Candidatus Eisenbacteria bacterium]|nr:hypothetical protein [Candidatus Eisenbacteria bacterium]